MTLSDSTIDEDKTNKSADLLQSPNGNQNSISLTNMESTTKNKIWFGDNDGFPRSGKDIEDETMEAMNFDGLDSEDSNIYDEKNLKMRNISDDNDVESDNEELTPPKRCYSSPKKSTVDPCYFHPSLPFRRQRPMHTVDYLVEELIRKTRRMSWQTPQSCHQLTMIPSTVGPHPLTDHRISNSNLSLFSSLKSCLKSSSPSNEARHSLPSSFPSFNTHQDVSALAPSSSSSEALQDTPNTSSARNHSFDGSFPSSPPLPTFSGEITHSDWFLETVHEANSNYSSNHTTPHGPHRCDENGSVGSSDSSYTSGSSTEGGNESGSQDICPVGPTSPSLRSSSLTSRDSDSTHAFPPPRAAQPSPGPEGSQSQAPDSSSSGSLESHMDVSPLLPPPSEGDGSYWTPPGYDHYDRFSAVEGRESSFPLRPCEGVDMEDTD
eukprot:CAMPEP_0182426892 /NCGR_PEP_ID=MMETSP1167-20130531/13400_1 /TAXON_ID=2988 /ORGANISM="Mallomonas Sp, Strain CCMP3275" /LENGTH=434 /DNA_ID=CAMNT_0024608637 /DNA_START=119 /DNA_END=1423 /DNA_ORIENTATION=-